MKAKDTTKYVLKTINAVTHASNPVVLQKNAQQTRKHIDKSKMETNCEFFLLYY